MRCQSAHAASAACTRSSLKRISSLGVRPAATVVWFGGNGQLLEEGGAFGKAQSAFTLTIKGTNADGTRFSVHQNGNAVFEPGVPKLEFFKDRTRCV